MGDGISASALMAASQPWTFAHVLPTKLPPQAGYLFCCCSRFRRLFEAQLSRTISDGPSFLFSRREATERVCGKRPVTDSMPLPLRSRSVPFFCPPFFSFVYPARSARYSTTIAIASKLFGVLGFASLKSSPPSPFPFEACSYRNCRCGFYTFTSLFY